MTKNESIVDTASTPSLSFKLFESVDNIFFEGKKVEVTDNSFSVDNTVTENFIPATMLPDSKIKATFGGEGFKRMIEALKKTGDYDIVNKSSWCCGCGVRDYMAVHIKSKKKASENFTDFYTLVRNAYTYNSEFKSVMNSRRDTHSVYKDKIFSDFVFGKEGNLWAN